MLCKEYIARYPDAEVALRSWWSTVQQADWKTFSDVRRTFDSADYVDGRTIVTIKGNDYRLATYIDYDTGIVVMK